MHALAGARLCSPVCAANVEQLDLNAHMNLKLMLGLLLVLLPNALPALTKALVKPFVLLCNVLPDSRMFERQFLVSLFS